MSRSTLKGLICAGIACALVGLSGGEFSYAVEQEGSFDFNVTVNKTLEVAVKGSDSGSTYGPTATASVAGGIGEFLRTSFTLKVSTNNANGYTATMTTDVNKTTNLVNESDGSNVIPTLSGAVTKSNFAVNNWGFSLDDTDAGNDSSTYRPVVLATATTPSTIAKYNKPVTDSEQEVFFGMMADSTKMAGNYSNTVVLTVVTNLEPIEEEDIPEEEKPSVPTTPASAPARMMASRPTSTSGEDTTTPSGEKPLGVLEDTTSEYAEKVIDSSKVGAGIALGVTTIAASGVIFFVVAKRREDDDDEEE